MRKSLKDFNNQIVLIGGKPSNQSDSYRHGKEVWQECLILQADCTNYDFFDVVSMRKKMRGPEAMIDHLWIPHGCFIAQYLPPSCKSPTFFYAIGKVEKYCRKNGSEDYCITPVDLSSLLDVAIQYFVCPQLFQLCLFLKKAKEAQNPNENSPIWKNRLATLQLLSHFLRQYPAATPTSSAMRLLLGNMQGKFYEMDEKFIKQKQKERKLEKRKTKGFGCSQSRQAIHA